MYIKSQVHGRVIGKMSDREFELVRTKCLESLGKYCPTLRSKCIKTILDFGDDSYMYLFLISD